jgi:lipopolysaccharide biosynthesis glycosyltransferase
MNKIDASNGVLFAATGQNYIDLSRQSASSIRETNPALEIDLFTDRPIRAEPFSRISILENVWVRSKIDAMISSRFEKSLYLDADTLVLADLSDVFNILDRFDIAFTHDQARNHFLVRREYKREFPNTFPQVNGGVIAFRKSQEVIDFLTEWRSLVIEHAIGKDQPALRELLWDTNLKYAILPPEYNLRDLTFIEKMHARYHTAPRIIHSGVFFSKPIPDESKDRLAHYLGPARAFKVQLLLDADETIARQIKRQTVGISKTKRQQLRWLALSDRISRSVHRLADSLASRLRGRGG